ncbi:MAG TPA: hypothetical protein VF311_01270 [Terriglobales bacterium]
MAIEDDLLAEIQSNIGGAIPVGSTTATAAWDLFEVYILTLVVRAAEIDGAAVSFQNVNGSTATSLVFRTSPGQIWSTQNPYSHAVLQFPGRDALEAHIGVRVAGKSKVLHEFDVCVLSQAEAQSARLQRLPPRSSKVIIGVECKLYTTPLKLGLARAFISLNADVSASAMFFVTNTFSAPVEQLLAARVSHWDQTVTPGAAKDVERFRNSCQTVFKTYKAR